MNALVVILAIVAIALLIVGGLVEAVKFLLAVGAVLLVLAIIVFIVRRVSGSRS